MKLQFAIAAFFLLLGAVELWEWLKDREIPFPMTVLGAVMLAVGSNYSKLPLDRWIAKVPKAWTEESSADSGMSSGLGSGSERE